MASSFAHLRDFIQKRMRMPTPMTLGNMRENGVRTLAARFRTSAV